MHCPDAPISFENNITILRNPVFIPPAKSSPPAILGGPNLKHSHKNRSDTLRNTKDARIIEKMMEIAICHDRSLPVRHRHTVSERCLPIFPAKLDERTIDYPRGYLLFNDLTWISRFQAFR
jgi:hypothetical protein